MAGKKPPRWTCPLCGRSVPADVDECYCGTSRAAVEAQANRDAVKHARPFSLLELVAGGAALAGAFYLSFLWFQSRQVPLTSGTAESPKEPAPPTRPSPLLGRSKGASLSMGGPMGLTGAGNHVGLASPLATPQPALQTPQSPPSPKEERSQADLDREAAEKDLERTFSSLEPQMRQLQANSARFESSCFTPPVDTYGCGVLFNSISTSAESLGRALEEADDEARQAFVQPGYMRDLREKHGLSEAAWSAMADKVRELAVRTRGGS